MNAFKKMLGVLLSLALCLSLSIPAMAASDTTVSFKANPPDENEIFTVAFSIKNSKLNALQFAVRFDPAVITPVDKTGAVTDRFFAFAEKNQAYLSTVGCTVNPETGFVGFTGYISPGETAAAIQNGEAVFGNSATTLFTFRFKKLTDGNPQFKIATKEQGEPYEHAFPEGMGIMSRNGASEGTVSFDFTALNGTTNQESLPSSGGGATSQLTAKQLLEKSIILKLGSPALVKDSGAMAFYPGEKSVVPFTNKDGRTMVPLRFLGETLGAEVVWKNDTQSVVLTKDSTEIIMTIGTEAYTINGKPHTMNTAPILMPSGDGNHRTMVPVRFVAEALGQTVAWEPARELIVIAPGSYTWNETGTLEQNVLNEASRLLLLYGGFV